VTNDELDALEKRAWLDLVEKPDRTSPADYPNMALITEEELGGYIRDALASLRRQLAEKETILRECVEDRDAIAEHRNVLHGELAEAHDWSRNLEIRANELAVERDSLQSQLTAERGRAEKVGRHLELSRQNIVGIERDRDEFWNKFQAEVKRGKTAREERDAALAEARELRELLKEARYEFIHITRYDENCEIIQKIDAKLTEGA
jgi:chromosome segregation ATPase